MRDAVRSTPWLTLPHDHIRHVVRSELRALGIALTVGQEGDVLLAHKAVAEGCAITELASRIASDISYLDVLVPFASDMSELAKLVLLSSLKLNVGKQHALVTLSKVEIPDSEVCLVDVLNADSSYGRRSDTEGVHRVHDTEVKVDRLCLEQSLHCVVHLKDLANELELKVNTLHAEGGSVDKLVRISDIKGATEEQVIIGRVLANLESQIVEEVVSLVGVRSKLVGERILIE